MSERTPEQRILDACWNFLGTIDPSEVERHLSQYVQMGRAFPPALTVAGSAVNLAVTPLG